MLRTEFNNLVISLGGQPDIVSEKLYADIELVYMYHPCEFEKETVAKLYVEFGAPIFKDLVVSAREAAEKEKELDTLKSRVRELTKELQDTYDLVDKKLHELEAMKRYGN